MPYIPPDTIVRILRGVPLDNTYRNTLTFTNAAAQETYFTNKAKYTESGLNFRRPFDFSIKIAQKPEDILDCNYIMFQNSNTGLKWFYAFITKTEYLSNSSCQIFYELDVMQTWYFNYTVMPSFVEREHTQDDTVGSNLILEGLEHGEYKFGTTALATEITDMSVVICTTSYFDRDIAMGDVDSHAVVSPVGGVYAGMYSGIAMYAFNVSTSALANRVFGFINDLNNNGKADGVSMIFMMPTALIPGNDGEQIAKNTDATVISKTVNKNVTSIDGYTPRNKKLLTHPYNFMSVTNFNGVNAVFPYEYFSGSTMQFEISSNVAPNPTVYLTPKYYKGQTKNNIEMLRLTGYPLCSWMFGAYQNYLAQNNVAQGVTMATSIIGIAAAVALMPETGGMSAAIGAGILTHMATSGVGNIQNVAAENSRHSVEPDHARGTQPTGSNISLGLQTFGFTPVYIQSQFAQRLDQFFDMYGYKTHTVKRPNITGRAKWNFVKTLEANIMQNTNGGIPVEDMAKIRQCYDHGITFWHDANTVGDYTQSNPIV